MRRILVITSLLGTALFLGSATLVSASVSLGENTSTAATAPASHEGDHDQDAGTQQGPPPDRGPADGVGRPQHAGLSRSAGAPQLPPQASARAHEAVALAFERQLAIQDRVAQIRALPGGREKGPAVSELMKQFGQLYRLTPGATGSGAS